MLATERTEIRRTDGPHAAEASGGAGAATPLPSPAELGRRLPLCEAAAHTVDAGRAALRDVLAGRDPRLVVIAGPCGVHDSASTLVYARRLKRLADEHADALVVLMRCYVEKPRTRLGWKGLAHDPDLDGSGDIARGIALSRALLLEISRMGLPCASELLDPVVARYLEDTIAWGSIGARTAHSQTHRELASGHPAPIGVKNAPDGDVQVAVDAVVAARAAHGALTIDETGRVVARRTGGNPDGHVVLRGGTAGPNADRDSIEGAADALGCGPGERPVLVDCSHGNARGDLRRQIEVARSLAADRSPRLAGLLIESHLQQGRQDWTPGTPPRPGLSLTDPCLGWRPTRALLGQLAGAVRRAGGERGSEGQKC